MKTFREWTMADVEAHQSRVGKRELAPVLAPVQGKPLVQVFAEEEAKAEFGFKPSTDEQKLNKTERAFLSYLRAKYDWVGVQSLTLKLGDDCRYTPDFWTVHFGRMTAWEVKGFWRDDAKAKIKIASRQFRMFDFCVVMKRKGVKGDWEVTEVKS
jgi:hypothetical protein